MPLFYRICMICASRRQTGFRGAGETGGCSFPWASCWWFCPGNTRSGGSWWISFPHCSGDICIFRMREACGTRFWTTRIPIWKHRGAPCLFAQWPGESDLICFPVRKSTKLQMPSAGDGMGWFITALTGREICMAYARAPAGPMTGIITETWSGIWMIPTESESSCWRGRRRRGWTGNDGAFARRPHSSSD